VLGSRAFLDVLAGNWYNFFPLEPTDAYGFASNVQPGRIDTGTNQRSGYHDAYQDQKRFKPQVYINMSYFQDGWAGSHDFKFGYDWKRDRRMFGRGQPFDIHYRDLNGRVNELEIYNSPNTSINDVVYNAGFISDTWKFNDRLTLNLGIRFEHYTDGFPDQVMTPNGLPQLANWPADVNPAERTRYLNFIAPRTVEAREVARTFNVSPRAGFAYDLTGDNRTVLKGYYGRFYNNSADTLSDHENPRRRPQQQPPARRTSGARAVPLHPGRGGFRQCRRQYQAPLLAGDLDPPRARDHDRPVRSRVVRLQERARRVGGNRSHASRRDDHPVQRDRPADGQRAEPDGPAGSDRADPSLHQPHGPCV
jgi:hypothetical protein